MALTTSSGAAMPLSDTDEWLKSSNMFLSLHPSFDALFESSLLVKYVLPFVESNLDHPTSREVCFQLIGEVFTAKYFGSRYQPQPHTLFPPYLSDEDRVSLISQFRSSLVSFVVEKCSADGFHTFPEVQAFLSSLSSCYRSQLELFRSRKASSSSSSSSSTSASASSSAPIPDPPPISVYAEVGSALSSLLSSSAFPIPLPSIDKTIVSFFSLNRPPSDPQGVSFYQQSQYKRIFSLLRGRVFPSPLRQSLYFHSLSFPPAPSLLAVKASVQGAAAERGIHDPTATDAGPLLARQLKMALDDAVVFDDELLGEGVGTCEARRESLQEVGIKALNMRYTLTGKGGAPPALLPFLFEYSAADPYDVMYLHHSFETITMDSLPIPELAAAAQHFLAQVDAALHRHVCIALAAEVGQPGAGGVSAVSLSTGAVRLEQLFRHVLSCSFVGYLPFDAPLQFVWDHCFLHGWGSSMSSLILADLLSLHRERLLMSLKGGVSIEDLLYFLQMNRDDILTKDLSRRYDYYSREGLVSDCDISPFFPEGVVNKPKSKLASLYKFKVKSDSEGPPAPSPLEAPLPTGLPTATPAFSLLNSLLNDAVSASSESEDADEPRASAIRPQASAPGPPLKTPQIGPVGRLPSPRLPGITAPAPLPADVPMRRDHFTELSEFYKKYNPERNTDANLRLLVEKYKGKEDVLWEKLYTAYPEARPGSNPVSDSVSAPVSFPDPGKTLVSDSEKAEVLNWLVVTAGIPQSRASTYAEAIISEGCHSSSDLMKQRNSPADLQEMFKMTEEDATAVASHTIIERRKSYIQVDSMLGAGASAEQTSAPSATPLKAVLPQASPSEAPVPAEISEPPSLSVDVSKTGQSDAAPLTSPIHAFAIGKKVRIFGMQRAELNGTIGEVVKAKDDVKDLQNLAQGKVSVRTKFKYGKEIVDVKMANLELV